MIKLNKNIYDDIKDEYVNSMLIKIKDNYKSNNNEYFGVKVSDFFEIDNQLSKEKIEKILLNDFSNHTNILLNNYLKTGLLIYTADFSIEDELKKNNLPINDINKSEYRINHTNKYMSEWIYSYIIKHYNYFESNNNYELFVKDIKSEFNKLSNELGKIIRYEYIDSVVRHKIITSSKITVCPYCDRQFISYFDGGKKGTADLDHFYPKKKFHLFALSLYNFIPSCQICNQRFKRIKVRDIVYPFKAGFEDDAKFKVCFNENTNVGTLYGFNDNFDLKIIIDEFSKNKNEIKNSKDLFHLEEMYEHHKDYVKELLLKDKLIYSNEYLEMVKRQFNNLNLTEEQLNIFLYGYSFTNEEFDNKKILKKLTNDILDK